VRGDVEGEFRGWDGSLGGGEEEGEGAGGGGVVVGGLDVELDAGYFE